MLMCMEEPEETHPCPKCDSVMNVVKRHNEYLELSCKDCGFEEDMPIMDVSVPDFQVVS